MFFQEKGFSDHVPRCSGSELGLSRFVTRPRLSLEWAIRGTSSRRA